MNIKYFKSLENRFSAMPIKILMAFLSESEHIILKFMWNQKRPHKAKTILRRRNKDGGIPFPDLTLFHKANHFLKIIYLDNTLLVSVIKPT